MSLLRFTPTFVIIAIFVITSNVYCVIHDQLVQDSLDITCAPQFIGGQDDPEYADDFLSNDNYYFTGLAFHYASTSPSVPISIGDIYLEIFEDDLMGNPICEIIFDYSNYIISETDYTFESKFVNRIDVEFWPIVINFCQGDTYWIALNMEEDEAIFYVGRENDNWAVLQENEGGTWNPYGPYDASIRLDGYVPNNVENTTMGQIKAIFK